MQKKKLVKALPHTDLIVLSFVDFNKNRVYEFKVNINYTMKRIKFYLEAMSFFCDSILLAQAECCD